MANSGLDRRIIAQDDAYQTSILWSCHDWPLIGAIHRHAAGFVCLWGSLQYPALARLVACSNQLVCNLTCSALSSSLAGWSRAQHGASSLLGLLSVCPSGWGGRGNIRIAGVFQCEHDSCSNTEEKFECQLTDGQIRPRRDDEADAKDPGPARRPAWKRRPWLQLHLTRSSRCPRSTDEGFGIDRPLPWFHDTE